MKYIYIVDSYDTMTNAVMFRGCVMTKKNFGTMQNASRNLLRNKLLTKIIFFFSTRESDKALLKGEPGGSKQMTPFPLKCL